MGITSQLWHTTAWGYRVDLSNIDTKDVYARRHILSTWQGVLVLEEFGCTRSEYMGKLFRSIPFNLLDIQERANFPKTTKISIRELPGLAWYCMRILNADSTVLRKDKPRPQPFMLKLTGAKTICKLV
jgi:hypothetical protein